MDKSSVYSVGGRRVVAMDSISIIDNGDLHAAIVSGSNGGMASGRHVLTFDCLCFFFNDAGVGKADAGIKGIFLLDPINVPAGTVSYRSARISDGLDSWENGLISALNTSAERAGFHVGERLQDALKRFLQPQPAPSNEH